VTEIAKVLAFIQESLATQIHKDSEGIRLLGVAVGEFAISYRGRVAIPLRRVTSVPLPMTRRAQSQQQIERSPSVVRRAPNLGIAPGFTQPAGAAGGIGLE